MSPSRQALVFCLSAVLTYIPPARAETCKPDEIWTHTHNQVKADTFTSDVKGSPSTVIEICRDKDPSGAGLKVLTQFAGERTPGDLAEGRCRRKRAKWGFVRSIGTATENGTAAVAKGVYRVCKE